MSRFAAIPRALLPCLLLAAGGAARAADSLSAITFAPASPALLLNNEKVTVHFHYSTDHAQGVRVYMTPYFDHHPVSYTDGGYPLLPAGGDSAVAWFGTFTDGMRVDSVFFRMMDEDTLLATAGLKVDYRFGPYLIDNISLSPASPKSLQPGDRVDVAFERGSARAGKFKIFTYPMSHGASVAATYGGDQAFDPGRGTASAYFTVTRDAVVDSILFRFKTEAADSVLAEFSVPVDFVYGNATSLLSPARREALSPSAGAVSGGASFLFFLPGRAGAAREIFDLAGRAFPSDLDASPPPRGR
jgi:hypothetical protein